MIRRTLTRELLARVAVAAVVYLVFAVTSPGYATSDNLFTVFEGAALIGIVAAGIAVTMLAGELDLSVGSVAACAGIVAVSVSDQGILVAVAAATLAATIFGVLQGWAIARLQISSLVFTLGTLIAMRGVAYKLSSEQTVNLDLDNLSIATDISARTSILSPFSLIMLLTFVVVGLGLTFSRWGREIYAIGGARKEARAAGVPQSRPIVLAFALSGGLAGLGGALASLKSGSATPLAYDSLLVTAVTAALIGGVSLYGGRGSMLGIFIGVMTLQFLLSGLALEGAPFWAASLATGALLLGFLLIELVNERSPARAALRRLRARRTAPAAVATTPTTT